MNAQVFTGDLTAFQKQQQSIRLKTGTPIATSCHSPEQITRWLIVGGGGFGREVYSWTKGQLHSTDTPTSVGFLDDNPDCLCQFPELNRLWVDSIAQYVPRTGDCLLMAIADPTAKLNAGAALQARGAIFGTYVHPTAILSEDCEIGIGCVLCPFAVVCCNVHIENFVSMNVGALAGHDSVIHPGCTLSPHANVAGQAILERGVFLGCQTVILPKVRVGEFARIGAGSAVISHVRPYSTMVGVPAKRISWSKSQEAADQKAA